MTPIASEANQFSQVSQDWRFRAVEQDEARRPTDPEIAVPTAVAKNSPAHDASYRG
jgi:hypothetical protein